MDGVLVATVLASPWGASLATPTLTWKRSSVYAFGTLVSEDTPLDGTIYIQGDQVGSPTIISNASGQKIGESKNLPFGERFGSTGTKSSRRYTNHEDQPGSAIYMQARTYLPAYGKFAQVDPAYDQTKDDPESWNLYGYVTNNPVTHTDPDGRTWQIRDKDGSLRLATPEEAAHLTAATGSDTGIAYYELPGGSGTAEGRTVRPLTTPPPRPAQTNQDAGIPGGAHVSPDRTGLDSFGDTNKAAAIKAGDVSGGQVGQLPVFVYGGTPAERTAVLNALFNVFTKSAQGGSELQALEARKTWFGLGSIKPFDVMVVNSGGSYTYLGTQSLMLDRHDVGAAYNSKNPGGVFTYERIIAHELGHAAMGVSDDGPHNMNNVIRNENRIMRELGDANDRLSY